MCECFYEIVCNRKQFYLLFDYRLLGFFFFACLNCSFVNKFSVSETLLYPFLFLWLLSISLSVRFFLHSLYLCFCYKINGYQTIALYFHKRRNSENVYICARLSTHRPIQCRAFVYFVGRRARCYCMWTGVWGLKCKLADTTINSRGSCRIKRTKTIQNVHTHESKQTSASHSFAEMVVCVHLMISFKVC